MNRKALIFAGVLLFSFVAAATQDAVTLRRELKENTTEVYKVATDVKQTVALPGQGDTDFNIVTTMKVTLKTGKLDEKGNAEVETITTDIDMKADGPMAGMIEQQKANIPKETKTTGKLNGRNQMTSAPTKGGGMMDMLAGGGTGIGAFIFPEFPEKEVKVGDTWTYNLPKSPMFGKEAPVMTAKLVGTKDLDGTQVWVVNTSGKFNLSLNSADMAKGTANTPAAGMDMTMKGVVDATGEALIDKATGKTLLYTTKAKSKSALEVQGMTIDTTGTVTTTLALQK